MKKKVAWVYYWWHRNSSVNSDREDSDGEISNEQSSDGQNSNEENSNEGI